MRKSLPEKVPFHFKRDKISIEQWLTTPNRVKPLVIGGNRMFFRLQNQVTSAVFAVVQSVISNPATPEKRSDEPGIWILLDELPELGRLEYLIGLLNTARSKGVRIILAGQSLALTKKVYGNADFEALWASPGNYLALSSDYSSCEEFSKIAGMRKVKELSSVSNGNDSSSETHSYKDIPILRPDEIMAETGFHVKKRVVSGIL